MQIVIDIGNSYTKTGVFDGENICEVITVKDLDEDQINTIFEKYTSIRSGIVSSVNNNDDRLQKLIEKHIDHLHIFSDTTNLPITNLYKTPETLGRDRIAGIVGATLVFPDNDVLVIDSGTAITFDFITKEKEYMGGNISPGINMRYKALHTFTEKLPLVTKKEKMSFFGDSTENAIVSGVQNGIIFETEAYITTMKEKYPGIKIIITGGDADFFEKNLKKNSIFVEQNIVLKGLNRILNYNV